MGGGLQVCEVDSSGSTVATTKGPRRDPPEVPALRAIAHLTCPSSWGSVTSGRCPGTPQDDHRPSHPDGPRPEWNLSDHVKPQRR